MLGPEGGQPWGLSARPGGGTALGTGLFDLLLLECFMAFNGAVQIEKISPTYLNATIVNASTSYTKGTHFLL